MDGMGRYIYISGYTGIQLTQSGYTGIQQNQISLFQLNTSTGAITEGPLRSNTTASQLVVETTDPAGNYLYAWNYSTNQDLETSVYNQGLGISVYKIDATTGALAEIPGSPFPVAAEASNWPEALEFMGMQFVMSPSGNSAYGVVLDFTNSVSNNGNSISEIFAFSVDPTSGIVTKLASYPISPNPLRPAAMVIHPNGKFLYISQSSGPNAPDGIVILAVDPATGAINPTPVSFVADTYCCSLLMNPSGSVLLDQYDNLGWHSFKVDGSTGLLTSANTVDSSYWFDYGGSATVVAIS